MPSGYDPMGGYRFSLATNAERVCAEIMLKQKDRAGMTIRPVYAKASTGFVPVRRSFSEGGRKVITLYRHRGSFAIAWLNWCIS